MSANSFYLEHGYTPEYRFQSFAGAGTLALWTPRGSARVVLTGISISSLNGGSLSLGWSYSSGGKVIANFVQGGSTTITPVLGAIEGTGQAETLWANVSASSSNLGYVVTATGFEIPNY